MTPYYEDEAVTIFLGDCREILPTLGPVDLVLTDPPYGVSGAQNTKTAKNCGGRKNDYLSVVDSVELVRTVVVPTFTIALEKSNGRGIVTPGNKCLTLYPMPAAFGCFYQPASVGLQPWGRADGQPILYYGKSPHGGTGLPSQSCSWVLTEAPEQNGHPCPKPFVAWKRLVACGSVAGETIIDPFMGSGTTLRAAKDLGRKAIGIEIEERYCEIAAKRMAQEVMFP